jgi:hypothetical protein
MSSVSLDQSPENDCAARSAAWLQTGEGGAFV